MNKTALATALALSLSTAALTVEAGTSGLTGQYTSQYSFDMTDPGDGVVPDTPALQEWTWDFDAGTISIINTETFFSSVWTAHDVVFTDNGDGTYGTATGVANMLFDWSVNLNIPVEAIWEVTLDVPTNTIFVEVVSSVIQASSPAFPGFHPAFSSPSLSCGDASALTAVDEAIDINIADTLFITCNFIDGTLVFDSFTQPANGAVTENAGVLTYTPNSEFTGVDEFSYVVKDTAVTATSRLITIQVGGELQGNFTMLNPGGVKFGGTNDVEFIFADGVDVEDVNTLNTNESDNNFGKLIIESTTPQAFNSFVWTAHHIRVFGPGDYAFDAGCTVLELENTGCPVNSAAANSKPITMHVGPDQIGAHILFDWSSSSNIDVVNVWNKNAMWDRLGHTGDVSNALFTGPAGLPGHPEKATWQFVSSDVSGFTTAAGVFHNEGDSFNGAPMVDGPFENFYANFSYKPDIGLIPPKPIDLAQRDTDLGSSKLASLDLYALVFGLFSLFGLRRFK